MTPLLEIVLSLLPVTAFLAALVALDSFKLVSVRSVIQVMLIGCVVAGVSFLLNTLLLDTVGMSVTVLRQYAAPLAEELLKAGYVVFLIQARRVGFIVDAAIYGFALGTGFALIENIYYLQALDEANLVVWVVRGFGTAIMHGSTTAIFAIISKSLHDRYPRAAAGAYLPGFLLALAIHTTFNHFPLNPVAQAALFVITLPLITVFVFERSEHATRDWLGTGFDTDVELLELLGSGEIIETRVGEYLQSLKSKFPGSVVGDMLSMLQIHLELSIRAKGILLAREAGIKVEPDEMVKANLEELKYLEKSVGKTGKLAMTPFLNMTSRDLWQLYMLGK